MIRYTSDKNIFVEYGDRSAAKFHKLLSLAAQEHFGNGPFEDQAVVVPLMLFCYNWAAKAFEEIILKTNDANFLFFLFANHESSIRLYLRRLSGFDLEAKENIAESTLALNRRILKLALETTCDVNYTHQEKVNHAVKQAYIAKLEDLLYIGKEIYGFAEHLAESRMIEDCHRLYFDDSGLLQLERKHHYDAIYHVMEDLFNDGFMEGIVSTELVHELKEKLLECMAINYDFAGGVIFEIMNHHSPGDIFQTVEPAVLPQNLVAHGVDEETAANFYAGLTISKHNKLKIADAAYKINSFERYMFRPVLTITHNGVERALVGREKWAESIMVMATNGFQWQRAPKEWMENKCFNKFLVTKHEEHDKLLEDQVEAILQESNMPFYRHALSFRQANGQGVRVDVEDVGEMDFVFIDDARKKIIVADCKYNRARYEMVGFSTDYKNFTEHYEAKLANKAAWLKAHIELSRTEFTQRYPGRHFDIADYEVIEMFIINTPTFYMMNGKFRTVTINNLSAFIGSNYSYPVISWHEDAGGGPVEKKIKHPYFRIQ